MNNRLLLNLKMYKMFLMSKVSLFHKRILTLLISVAHSTIDSAVNILLCLMFLLLTNSFLSAVI